MFLQTDPIGYQDDLNLYAYVGGDPVNKTDPTGTECRQGADGEGVCVVKDERSAAVRGRDPGLASRIAGSLTARYNWAINNPGGTISVRGDVPDRSGAVRRGPQLISGAEISAAMEQTDYRLADQAYGVAPRNPNATVYTGDIADTVDLTMGGKYESIGRFRFITVFGSNIRDINRTVGHEIAWALPQYVDGVPRGWHRTPESIRAADEFANKLTGQAD